METLDNQEEQTIEMWLERLAGVPTVLEIPSDNPHPRHDTRSSRLPIEISAETTTLLRRRSQTSSVPPLSILLAAFGLTLSRLTGASTLLVGVGSVSKPVPVRLDVNDDFGPEEFIHAVHESLTWSLDRGNVPSGTVAARLGMEQHGRRHPLIQTFFAVHGRESPEEINAEPATTRAGEVVAVRSEFDIAIEMNDSVQSFSGYAIFATGLWDGGEAERFVTDYLAAVDQLLDSMTADPSDITLADVRCISAEARKILQTINQTSRVFPSSSVDELFRRAAQRWPAAPAVRDAESVLTYSELAVAATEQAHLLRAAGVREGDTVLIGVPRSVAETVAVLGTLWTGSIYIGIDLSQPDSHTAKIIAKASPAAAIVADDGTSRIASHDVRLVSSWHRGWVAQGKSVSPVRPDPNRLAYIAFTSGSTGEPKGVAIPHRGIIRLVHGGKYLTLGPGERFLRMSPLAFDASTLEIWGSLLTGSVLEVCPPDHLSPMEIGDFLAERQITVAWLTAGLFRLVQEFATKPFGSLRHLLTGGDIVPHEQIKQALTENPGLVVTNGYGPTENTTFTTVHSVRDSTEIDGPIPIGIPVPGTRVYVLDKRARLLMPGAVGELYCAGEGLAAGYFEDEEGTGEAFGSFSPDVPERLYRTGDMVRIDAAGRLRFLGREDDQVKIRGFRIELPAISESLNAQEEVRNSVVTVTDGDSVDKKLIAAVELRPGKAITPAELSERLRDHLPSYMVPPLWAVVDQMPVTANGKIDRRRLSAIARPVSWFASSARIHQSEPSAK
ncbi:amino acid adenylation domain-containing protein [Micromonospora sp. Llam0]|uniref:amino acid adenylation domain-containing protein n=1 Tax=Micromonospora sp. Llam0 TaxID=2485143 RepID=UPI000F48397B|nr:amino acid adenylation domain-containing protein [Micromonospora sp. Llam0]ROO59991.1 amino acid adenylation domain-containing protein [Micromonospora sp. Llam0]